MNHKVVVMGVEFNLIFEEVIHGNAETLKCGSIEFGRVSDKYWIPFLAESEAEENGRKMKLKKNLLQSQKTGSQN